MRRIYWGKFTAGRKSEWQGRDEGEPSAPREGASAGVRFVIGARAICCSGSWYGVVHKHTSQHQNAAHNLVTKKAEENCKTHLPWKWGRNISEFDTTSHFCTQKSCQSSKNTTNPEYKHDSYQFTIPKILRLEGRSRWNDHDQVTLHTGLRKWNEIAT